MKWLQENCIQLATLWMFLCSIIAVFTPTSSRFGVEIAFAPLVLCLLFLVGKAIALSLRR